MPKPKFYLPKVLPSQEQVFSAISNHVVECTRSGSGGAAVVLGQLHMSVCLCKTVNVCMRLSTPKWRRMFLSMSVCICGSKYTPGYMCHLRTLRLTLKPPAQGIAASQLNCRSLPSPTTPTVVHDSPTRGQRPASLPVGRPNFAV